MLSHTDHFCLITPTKPEGRQAKDYSLHFSYREAAVNRLQTIADPASGSPEAPPQGTSDAQSWDSSLTLLREAAFPIGKTSIIGLQVFRGPPKKTRKSILPCRLVTHSKGPRPGNRPQPRGDGLGMASEAPVPYPRVATDPLSTCWNP